MKATVPDCSSNTPNYTFEEYVERRGSSSYKWDHIPGAEEVPGVLPFWVADMDFPGPPQIQRALEERARHGIFGYHFRSPEYVHAVKNWILHRHGWGVPEEHLTFTPPGVIYAVDLLLRQLTKPGDPILVHTPGYTPLLDVITLNGRKAVTSPLTYCRNDSRFYMDFEDMEKKIRENSLRFMLFCSPHNPTGRVWSREELFRLEKLCSRYGITILSDEIHGDLIYPGERHIPLGSLSEYTLNHGITIFSATKSFNLGGLQGATVITGNAAIRRNLSRALLAAQTRLDNIFGAVATQKAYETGAPWLEAFMRYIRENFLFLQDFLKKEFPSILLASPQGTYFAWMDMRPLGLSPEELRQRLIHKGKIALLDGCEFGTSGEGFQRMNLACPRSLLEKGAAGIRRSLQSTA